MKREGKHGDCPVCLRCKKVSTKNRAMNLQQTEQKEIVAKEDQEKLPEVSDFELDPKR